MAIGDGAPELIHLIDWEELYKRDDGDEALIPGLAFRGRWTAIAAPAKEGKSTVILGLVITLARQLGIVVLYLDHEMGRADVLDRVDDWMHLKPADLKSIHYSDIPPKLDTVQGATMLGATVEAIQPDLVVIDGLNGVVQGAENDDTTWRDLYEWSIAPLKARNIAVISLDNLGKDKTLGPRGSSVKLDKADAIITLERTDNGSKLTATHRRTAAYPLEQYFVVSHASEEGPPMTVTAVAGDMPAGTTEIIKLLDDLGVPVDIGIREARRTVRNQGRQYRNGVIDAAVKLRRTAPIPPPQMISGDDDGLF